jgi:mitofilin
LKISVHQLIFKKNTARANLELQANNAKQLWLAVQSLDEIINSKASELNTNNSELVQIKTTIERIKQSAPENEFIQKLINSIPHRALNNGVWSEPDLKERFHKLKKVCNQVALIDDRGGSLFKYAISYLQSFFILHAKIDKETLDKSQESIDLHDINLNTFNILDYSQYYLDNNNFESAIKLLQQLKGEPGRLARDWIDEAILLSEIKQASNLLIAYISSIYIGTEFK